ncbi:hypothetical protein [Polyangium sp. 15x6]|uniref:hypothetical protein n=1 Tax=Polyangium sp. 15x6 TaxID=3042687 RepID=UPI00249B9607|nr:hypothetical protein [Polyangium sp. 15x6]MDI3290471.1 hypothetical protein [Polyangium sp. 15x6]
MKPSGMQVRRFAVGLAGLLGFSILMALRDEVSSIFGRAVVAAVAALVGVSAFMFLQKTRPSRRSH